jgi:hypothetical protein
MDIKMGDLVILTSKINNTKIGKVLSSGDMGIVIDLKGEFLKRPVYGVVVNRRLYYLFDDEFEKMEETC